MKLTLTVAAMLIASTGVALAQPSDRGPAGSGGFGMLAMDANADGRISRAELDTIQRTRFDGIDANRDGFATPEEFKASREKERTARQSDMADRRFSVLDADSNGQISKSEFSAGNAPGRDGPCAQRGPGREFRMGGPGGRHGKPSDNSASGPRLGPDADADGKVSFAEFSARAVEAFNRADANKDGVVTIAELQAGAPSRR